MIESRNVIGPFFECKNDSHNLYSGDYSNPKKDFEQKGRLAMKDELH